MAVVGNLHKIAFGGRLATTEEWSCGIHFLSPTAGPLATVLIETALEQWVQRATSCFPNFAWLDWLKVNQINPVTGLYTDPGNPRTFFFPIPKSGTATPEPPQNTVAISTYTAVLRGRASKGRFFPPFGLPPGASIGADGRLAALTATNLATSGAQLLTDLNGSNDGDTVVFSKVGQITNSILGAKVGRVVDTQQRRRRNLVEDRQTVPIS